MLNFRGIYIPCSKEPKSLVVNLSVSQNRVPQNGWFIVENPIKMDDLGVSLFSETSI